MVHHIKNWKNWSSWIGLNFAAPIAFFWTFRAAGAKPAILLAIVVTLGQVIFHRIYDIRFSPFFIVASGFTILFGSMDLLTTQPRFFRLEPFAQNFLMGTVFMLTLFTKTPVVAWFANGLPPEFRPDPHVVGQGYLRKMTFIWALYFYLKGFFFLYLALHVDLGELILLRSIIGGGTLVLMVAGEIAYRKWWLPRRSRHSESSLRRS